MSAEEVAIDDPDARERLSEVVTLSFTKSNYSRRGEPILLRRDAENGGALLPLDDADKKILREAQEAAPSTTARTRGMAAVNAKVRDDAARVLALVTADPGIGTRKLRDKSRLGPPALGRALEALLDGGTVRDVVTPRGAREDHHYFPKEQV